MGDIPLCIGRSPSGKRAAQLRLLVVGLGLKVGTREDQRQQFILRVGETIRAFSKFIGNATTRARLFVRVMGDVPLCISRSPPGKRASQLRLFSCGLELKVGTRNDQRQQQFILQVEETERAFSEFMGNATNHGAGI